MTGAGVVERTESTEAAAVAPGAIHFVSSNAVRSVLSWPDVIERIRTAYELPHATAASPRRVVTRNDGAWLRALAAAPPGARFMGAKVFGVGRRRRVNYLITLFEQETGEIRGLVDAALITAFRTAATSGVAIDRLAPARPLRAAVLGSGLEAHSHVRAAAAVRPLTELRVFSPTPARREAFAATFQRELNIPVVAVARPEDAVRGADLVLAAARSRDETPILYGDWLSPGMTVVSIGSTLPEQREIDVSVVERCDLIVCDVVDEVAEETGDMIAAEAAGVEFRSKTISLNTLMRGRDARAASAMLPLFKSIGAGLQDLVVAELAFEKSLAQGLAAQLPIEFYNKR